MASQFMNARALVLLLSAGFALAGCGGGGSSAASAVPTPPPVTQADFSQGLTLKMTNFGGNTIAPTAANVLPISIAPKNLMLIAVKVCKPGTASCATVDKVLLDTGSVGLRLHASTVQGILGDTPSPTIVQCGVFGSFYTWGPLREMNLWLGGVQTGILRVQLYDDSSVPAPASKGCGMASGGQLADPLPSIVGFNGVLGIKGLQVDSQPYYTCSATNCDAVSLPQQERLPNPVARLSDDSNGYSIQFPSVSDGGENGVTGALVLGIGTRSNNGLSATVTRIPLDGNQAFQLWIGGMASSAWIDSGTGASAFPNAPGLSLPTCTTQLSMVYCPSSTASFRVLMKPSTGAAVVLGADLSIGNGAAFLSSGMAAFNAAAMAIPATFTGFGVDAVLGVPFFFGRNIYFSIEGQAVTVDGSTSSQAFIAL